MNLTPEMAEMMERTMEQYYAAYWQKHATPEQEARRVAEGKTFKGAFAFAKSVAEKYRGTKGNGGCVAMPDELAYWLLMEYMEHEKEGAKYRTPEEVEADAKRAEEAAERRRKAAEEKARLKREELERKTAELNADALLTVTAEQVAAAEARAAAERRESEAVRAAAKAEKSKAAAVAERLESAQMSLFA